ncbi:S-layer homology domain-containing protein [Paenibacillus sp. FSL H8-0261]|uniref:S-layer homology domain-containing protein n=1 Tax=Paenibacillus sp. FSL H8-0261 TaxID=2921381 RepID=UPI0032551762
MKGRKPIFFIIAVLFVGLLAPAAGPVLAADPPITTQSLSAESDLLWDSDFGVFNNDMQGRIYIGKGIEGGAYTARGALRFNLDSNLPHPGRPIKYELQLYVNFKEGSDLANFYLDAYGSDNNDMDNTDRAVFPQKSSINYTRKSNNQIPNDGFVTFDVTPIVAEITSAVDRQATFILQGNESLTNARAFVSSKEYLTAAYHPKLIVTYAQSDPPTGSIAINNGALYTNSSSVKLNLTASDPDVEDVLQVRFSNDQLTWSKWEDVLSSKNWTLFNAEGIQTVYYQITDGKDIITLSDTITLDTVKPVVSGITNNGLYNSNRTISFNEGYAMLNGSPFTSGTVVSVEGTYTFIAVDAAGNSTTIEFQIDKTAPTVYGIINNGIYKADMTVTFNEGAATLNGSSFTSGATVSAEGSYKLIVTDTAGNVTTVNFSINKTAPTVTGVADGTSYNVDRTITFNEGTATMNGHQFTSGATVSAEGDYTLVVSNAAGNITTVNFTIDKTIPKVTGATDGESYNVDRTVTFNEGTATLNGSPFTSGATVSAEGSYKLIVTDAAGNVTTVNFSINKTAPTVTGVADGTSYNVDRTVTFNEGTATLNGSPFTSGATVSAEGDYTLVVSNAAGNNTTVNFTIDKTIPKVTGAADGTSYNVDRTITFNEGTATMNGHPFTSGATVSTEGSYKLIVTDAAGNNTTVNFTIDKTNPTVIGVADGESYNVDRTITFNMGAATLNGDSFVSGSEVRDEGDYTLIVTDGTGNVTTIQFTIDKTAPAVSGVTEGSSYNTNQSAAFNEGTASMNGDPFVSGATVSAEGDYTLVVTDAAGNVTTVNFTIDKTAPTVTGVAEGESYNVDRMIAFNEGTATMNGDSFTSGATVSGEGSYKLIVTDAAGNVTTVNFTMNKTGPSVIGVVYGASYNTDRTITFNMGTATLNGDSFVSGSEVRDEGDYTLVVTDAAGNITTVSFTIDKTNPKITGLTAGISNYTSPLTIGFNEGTATLNGQPFTNGATITSSANYTLVVTDAAGNQTSVTFTLNVPTAQSGSDSVSSLVSSLSSGSELEIEINGVKHKDLGKVTTAVINGKKVTTVTFDEAKLSRYLDSLSNKPFIFIPVHNDSDRVLLLLNSQIIKTLNDRNADIQIQTELASYLLAANQIDWSLVAKSFGSEDALRNMEIQVEINNAPDNDIEQVSNKLGEARLLSPVINFNISAKHGGTTIELNKFLSYVERTITIPNSADPYSRIMTGITITKDGNIVPVPTRIVKENGKTFAIIYSLTNSAYAVIENSKTFADIQKHWAKKEIEQAASKLIVQGISESSFQPNKQITRAEFTAMLVRALGLHEFDQSASFSDIKSGQWYYETVSIAEGYGLVTTSNSSQYIPNEKLSREEAMVLLAKAMKLAGLETTITDREATQQLSAFKDHHLLNLSARAAAALNIKYGIIKGNQGQLTPDNVITRAEMTVILQRFLEAAKLS